VVATAVTVTVATGGITTVTPAVPVFPSTVAVIVALPGPTPVTTPVLLTVAIAWDELVQATVRLVSVFPFASFGVAVSDAVCPTMMSVPGLDTATDATAGGPEESPLHAANATVQSETSASRVRIVIVLGCRGEPAVPPFAATDNLGHNTQLVKGFRR
jgi:hypothetical protein